MALVRILVDGYSLLHSWPELAPRAARHSLAAREALISVLTQYQDVAQTPITIFFDGQGAPQGTPKTASRPELEILYSRAGQTADDMIERTAVRLREYGEVLVVTDDIAERDTVFGFGVMSSSCGGFINQIVNTLRELVADLKFHNRRERHRFRSSS